MMNAYLAAAETAPILGLLPTITPALVALGVIGGILYWFQHEPGTAKILAAMRELDGNEHSTGR